MKTADVKKLYLGKDKMHNWNHILRIKKTVKILKEPYKNLDEGLLNFLILFHGLKDYVQKNETKFPKTYSLSLVRSHKNPKKTEEKLVFDANMLDNLGKHGIKKALYVGRKLGRTKTETYKYLKQNIKNVTLNTKIGKSLGKKELSIMEVELK